MSNQDKKRTNADMNDDFVGAGFHRLDDHLIQGTPPKIKWSNLYKDQWSDKRRVQYLQKLSATMNHAARIIQGERNDILKKSDIQEKQIKQLGLAMAQNTAMLQSEVMRMNGERQDYNARIKDLNAEIKQLRRKDNN